MKAKYVLKLQLGRSEQKTRIKVYKWQTIFEGDKSKKGEYITLAKGNPKLAVFELCEEGYYKKIYQENMELNNESQSRTN